MKKWEDLPESLKNERVKYYFEILKGHKGSLLVKRVFDIIVSGILLVLLCPVLIIVSILIKVDSKGPVMFRQERVTQYGRSFLIYKFRTMVENAEQLGSQVTTSGDMRVTRIGQGLRKYRVDELPQLLNIFLGEMTFVGTRPEVVKYVKCYTDEMKATLLLPAGVTSKASIRYKDEEKLLESAENADEVYINQVLPGKMKYNLEALENFNFYQDIKTMIMTVIEVLK